MAAPAISAFLPAYNEAGAIAATVQDLRRVLERVCETFEIVIVDDGSTDATPAIAGALAAQDPRIRVVRHPVNRGYGAAVRSGLRAARYDLLFLTDGDGQFDPAQLADLLPLVAQADIVAGYRLQRADPPHRALYARLWASLMRLLLGTQARDVDCAFKLFRRSAVADLDLKAEGAFISAELLARAARRGARIVEVGVRHRPRRSGRQTGGTVGVMARAFVELVRLYPEIRRMPRAGQGRRIP